MPTVQRPVARCAPVYVVPGGHAGLVVPGNIDVARRPIIVWPNGTISTVRSVSWQEAMKVGGRTRMLEVLMPTVIGQRIVSDRAAERHFKTTGQHLGAFDTVAHANAYADRLHRFQAFCYRRYLPLKGRPPRN